MFTDADNFGVLFPPSLDVQGKACLLAAVFFIVGDTDCDMSSTSNAK